MPLIFGVETPSLPSEHEGVMASTRFQTVALPVVARSAANRDRLHVMLTNNPARFPRAARLLRHADFERVYKEGRRHFSATLTAFYLARPTVEELKGARTIAPHGLRVGFTVGRALGDAVQRNRMKRRLREAVRLTRPVVGVEADVVINPKKSLLTADFENIVKEVSRAFEVIQQNLSQNFSQSPGRRQSRKNGT